MPLESGTYISDLQPDWPTGQDPESAGDDHLRLLKQVIKNTWPNIDAALTGTPGKFNNLTSGIGFEVDDPASGLPSHWNMFNPDGSGIAPVAAGTPTKEQYNGNVAYALTWRVMQEIIYPVGTVIMNKGTNPEDYLGFGTWQQNTGWLVGGGGVITDGYGNTETYGVGAIAGSLQVHPEHIAPFDIVGNTGAGTPHHHSENEFSFTGSTGFNGGGDFHGEVTSQQTGDEEQHAHPVELTVGTGTSNFTPPSYAVYVWERIA